MASRDPSATPDTRRNSGSATNSPGKDGLERVELSDLEASPPQLPVEQGLMQLARLGELRGIQKLFDSGRYNAKSTDEQGITALHWAAINGHHALCHFLIQSGADVNAKGGDAEATPVLWASKRCHLQVVQLLLAHGADPLTQDDQGYNLLHSAVLDGNVLQLTLLLHQPDIPVDVPDVQGHTSLMWAAYKGFPSCVDLLLRWGADIHATDDMGFTALHWALVKGSYPCIQKLVDYGSDRFAVAKPLNDDITGDTPSMTAAKMKSERQWRKALFESGYDEYAHPIAFPVPFIKDKKWFFSRLFFFWPFFLGGLQLHMLAYLRVWISVPGVLIVGYGLNYLVQRLFRWAPSDMKSMHHTPFLAGIFAATLFWVGVRWALHVLPNTLYSNFFLNIAFAVFYGLTAYFYFMTMTADPGYIPKSSSRGQTKKTIDDLLENNIYNEKHFCTPCMIRKPLRSKHCRRCGRCVARQDHHCPWVDTCIGVNNHKHFLLYVISLIIGIAFLIRLTFVYLEQIPAPPRTEIHCDFVTPDLCATIMKDPLTLVTNIWGSLQLTWTFMLVFVHFVQIARALTTYESMRGSHATETPGGGGPNLMAAIATGSVNPDSAQITASGGGPDPTTTPTTTHGGHLHSKKPKETCLASWKKMLGLDVFFAIAFNGYNGSKNNKKEKLRNAKRPNPFTRGVFRNCQDFWADGPVFGRKESGFALLGGRRVDYSCLYEVPRGMRYRGGYEEVAGVGLGEGEGAEV